MACASSDIHDTLNVLMALCRIVRPCHQWRIQKFFKGGPEKTSTPFQKILGIFFSLKSQKKFQLPSKIFGGPFFSPKSENNSSTPLNTPLKPFFGVALEGGPDCLRGAHMGEKFICTYNCSNMRLQGP